VQRWLRKRRGLDIFTADVDVIFFPINTANTHWSLAAVSPRATPRTIAYMDSKLSLSVGAHRRGWKPRAIGHLQQFLRDEWRSAGHPGPAPPFAEVVDLWWIPPCCNS
jgi:hypothetical protein